MELKIGQLLTDEDKEQIKALSKEEKRQLLKTMMKASGVQGARALGLHALLDLFFATPDKYRVVPGEETIAWTKKVGGKQ